MMFTALAAALLCAASSQTPQLELTPQIKTEVVERLLAELEKGYVFPRVAEDMDFEIRERLKAGAYDKIGESFAFAATLTDHLREISSDKHLSVTYSPEGYPVESNDDREPTAEEFEAMRREGAWNNFGFESASRLTGNIGYLDLREFAPPQIAAPTAHAAFGLLANTDALIVDLRGNGGGSPEMVQLLCSYLFGPERVHLNDLYFRPSDETREYWTLPELPGPRYLDKEVFVLTSSYTFSAAEEFTYNLQCLKRATIVGQTTGGGAHPGGRVRLNEHFAVFVPNGRAINPITKTNWEGVGVAPDVECSSDAALPRAHALALERLVAKAKDPAQRRRLEAALANAQIAVRNAYSER